MLKITIDIETIPGPTRPEPSDIKAPANYKDLAKIAAYQEDGVESEWRSQALHPLKGRILCIGYAIEDEELGCIFSSGDLCDEAGVVLSFSNALYRAMPEEISDHQMPGHVLWIGHNVAEFDLVWLKLRAMKYNNKWLSSLINLDRCRGNYFDTMQALGSWKDKFSLDDACQFFGLGCKPAGMDGSKVFELWQAGKYEDIANYCKGDVDLARKLYRRLS